MCLFNLCRFFLHIYVACRGTPRSICDVNFLRVTVKITGCGGVHNVFTIPGTVKRIQSIDKLRHFLKIKKKKMCSITIRRRRHRSRHL